MNKQSIIYEELLPKKQELYKLCASIYKLHKRQAHDHSGWKWASDSPISTESKGKL